MKNPARGSECYRAWLLIPEILIGNLFILVNLFICPGASQNSSRFPGFPEDLKIPVDFQEFQEL